MPHRIANPTPEAIKSLGLLQRSGIRPKLCSRDHIKVGPWNFYPAHGRIHRDGGERLEERGLDTFIQLVMTDPSTVRFRRNCSEAASPQNDHAELTKTFHPAVFIPEV